MGAVWTEEFRALHSKRMAAIWEARRNGERPMPKKGKRAFNKHGNSDAIRGHAPKPGGWKEAKAAGRKTYIGAPCDTCNSEVRMTLNCGCYTCDLAVRAVKAKERDARIAERKKNTAIKLKERSLFQQARAEERRQAAEERMQERREERAASAAFRPNRCSMAGVNYGGDPDLGLNDNSYPDKFPYNISLSKPPGNTGRSQIGCAAAQCADFA